jgi:hypothetical protein
MLEINQQHKMALYESLSTFERTTVSYLSMGLKCAEVAVILNKPVTSLSTHDTGSTSVPAAEAASSAAGAFVQAATR